MEKDPFEIYKTPLLQSPSLIVFWKTRDFGGLGSRVIEFLIEKLGGQEIAEIKPLGFFSFGGVRFKNDIVQTPESKFWACEKANLLIFQSDEPVFDHDSFLNFVLDFAEHYHHVREIYTVSGAIFLIPHTKPRRVLTVCNQSEIRERLQGYGTEGMTWQGPPAMSSYLLWIAKRRGIPGVSLWPEIPFYLATGEDPEAIKVTVSFLNRRFNLDLNTEAFDSEVRNQREKLAQLRGENPEVDQHITKLESGAALDEEEQMKLSQQVQEYLA